VCFDVGANVGVYVLQLAHWSGKGGKVVAFEPNPAARNVLRRHVAMNGLEGRVEIVPAAISNAESDLEFYSDGASGQSRLQGANPAIADSATVSQVHVTTIDAYVERARIEPDWIVIDIEGFEIAALRGAANLISRRRGKLGIVVEFHPNQWAALGESRATVHTLLNGWGLQARPLAGQADVFTSHASVALEYV
jgi:FkbM family methyltransferase